jgi:hypothetical protein
MLHEEAGTRQATQDKERNEGPRRNDEVAAPPVLCQRLPAAKPEGDLQLEQLLGRAAGKS